MDKGSIEYSESGSSSKQTSGLVSESGIWLSSAPEMLDPWRIWLQFRWNYFRIVGAEPVLFLYMFGILLYFSQFQQYLLWRYGNEKLQNTDYPFPKAGEHYCISLDDVDKYADNSSADVEASANHLSLYAQMVSLFPSIISALILGPISDRYGRKLPMLLVGCGATLSGILVVMIVFYNLNMYFFILSSALTGFTGGFATVVMACFSYTVDVSSVKLRTLRIALLEATIFIAGGIAEGIGGFWLQKINCNFVPPMCVFVAANALIVLYVVLLLPESVSRQERLARARTRTRGPKALLQGFKIYFGGHKMNYSLWKLWFALIAMSFVMINTVGSTLIMIFFLKHVPLDFHARLVGFYQLSTQISHGFSLIVIMPLMILFRMPDPLIALTGVAFSAAMNVFTGFARVAWEMFVISVIQGMEAVVVPSLRSLMSKLVQREDQGALFSFIASVEVFSTLIAGGLYNNLYPATLKENMAPGTIYFLIAIIYAIPAVLIGLLLIFHKRKTSLVVEIESPATDPAPPEEEKSLLGDSSYNNDYGTHDKDSVNIN